MDPAVSALIASAVTAAAAIAAVFLRDRTRWHADQRIAFAEVLSAFDAAFEEMMAHRDNLEAMRNAYNRFDEQFHRTELIAPRRTLEALRQLNDSLGKMHSARLDQILSRVDGQPAIDKTLGEKLDRLLEARDAAAAARALLVRRMRKHLGV